MIGKKHICAHRAQPVSKKIESPEATGRAIENVKKIGFVSEENIDITLNDKILCNLRVDQLTEKFNNSISSCF